MNFLVYMSNITEARPSQHAKLRRLWTGCILGADNVGVENIGFYSAIFFKQVSLNNSPNVLLHTKLCAAVRTICLLQSLSWWMCWIPPMGCNLYRRVWQDFWNWWNGSVSKKWQQKEAYTCLVMFWKVWKRLKEPFIDAGDHRIAGISAPPIRQFVIPENIIMPDKWAAYDTTKKLTEGISI